GRAGRRPHRAEQGAEREGERDLSSASAAPPLAPDGHMASSSKVVARKRRDRSLPRAFEIFTDSRTYVLKAQDQKNAQEWLQCINVAVAQARERENGEATTYL
ncbi:unnamed protein product, partial [Tetraodon nigroviridis]